MKQAKTLSLAICVLLAVIVSLQNTEAVDTRLLFVTVTLPRALLLILTFLIGIAAGLLLGARMGRRKEPEPLEKP